MKKSKKEIFMNGSLLRPLTVGQSALLYAGGKLYHTTVGHQSSLKQFAVTIEEHLSQDFPVRARDFFHAFQIAEDAYRKGKMVVEPSAPNTRLMMARDNETGEITQWKEF